MLAWIRTGVASAALLAASVVAASALDIGEYTETQFNDPNAQANIGALMAPIAPLVSGNAGSTTSIIQIGINNDAHNSVNGAASLGYIEQSGQRNRAVQAIEGSNSAALLVQGGRDNNVIQAINGDNNFQLVGVSGNIGERCAEVTATARSLPARI